MELADGRTLVVGIDGSHLLAALTFRTVATTTTPPDAALGILASRNWPSFTPTRGVYGPGGKAAAVAWIKYADSNQTGKLRRPLVFVEGIDFEATRGGTLHTMVGIPLSYGIPNYPVTSTGPIALANFSNGIGAFPLGGYRNGSNGWNEVVDYSRGSPELEKFSALRERLQAPPTQTYLDGTAGGDFDIIYLDFSDGASLIQQNAMTLVELLQWINNPANRTANAEETVVIGASMGGQGNTNEPHVQLTNGEPSSYGHTSYFTNNGYWLRNELRESAHNMPANLDGNTANATYNYGSPYRHLLPSVAVVNGGQLYINNGALPVSGGTPATQSAPPASSFEVYTSGCGTRVSVASGGSLSVGVSSTHTASLLIANNDLLDIGRSGQLTVSAGSVLRGQGSLVLNGQLLVDAGAYICVENPTSIATGPNGQLSVDASAHRSANPALGLAGLACQYHPPCTPALYFDVRQNQRLAAKTAPAPGDTLNQPSFNYCSGLLVLTAQGTGLDTDFQWTVNGQPRAGAASNPGVLQFVAHAGVTYDVTVTVHSTCDGSLLSYQDNMVQGNFPNCRVAASPVAMYPNPATSKLDFALEAGSSAEAGEYEVSLYDGQGALRWHGRSEAGQLHAACAGFARGLYGVVITQGSTVVRRNLSLE
jgi:hypothetical protein